MSRTTSSEVIRTMTIGRLARGASVFAIAAVLCPAGGLFAQEPVESAAVAGRLRSADPRERIEAARGLARTGGLTGDERLLQATVAAMNDPVEEVRLYAVTAVAATAYTVENAEASGLLRTAPALIERLHDPAAEVQEAAAQALALLGTPTEATADLLDLVDSGAAPVRRAAIEALARLPHAEGAVRDALVERLRKDPAEAVRGEAANALAALRLIDDEVVNALRKALADPSDYVQQQAIRALGEIGPQAAAAAPELEKLAVNAGSETVRRHAEYALRSIRGERSRVEPRSAPSHVETPPAGSPPAGSPPGR